MAETPAATAVDAQAAERSAEGAAQSAQEANTQAAVAAANATEAARVRMEQIASENNTRINKLGEDFQSWRNQTEPMIGALTGLQQESQALRQELSQTRADQATMAEALKKLLSPPPPVQEPVKPPAPESAGAEGRQEAKTQAQKRRIIRI